LACLLVTEIGQRWVAGDSLLLAMLYEDNFDSCDPSMRLLWVFSELTLPVARRHVGLRMR